MPEKTLRALAAEIGVRDVLGNTDALIRDIAYDSRDAGEGSLFVALEGLHEDGHRFITDAVKRGAVAVMHSRPFPDRSEGVGYIRVPDTRAALSPISAAFFDHPSKKLAVIGVTGTDGKSSTVWFIHQLLEALGRKSGFLSTVSFHTGNETVKNPFRQSTPEAPEIQGMLAEIAANGREFAVVEATSHGLSAKTGRLADVLFDAAVMTNVTHEHLEFHGTWERYRSDKANLFRALDSAGGKCIALTRFGVVNADDPSRGYFEACTKMPVYSYGILGPADLRAGSIRLEISGCSFTLHSGEKSADAFIPIPGPFWASNCLAACLAVSRALSIDPLELAPHLQKLRPVKGRMEPVDLGQDFKVIVDYAHTPGAFERLFPWVREHFTGRLIAVFGSAGERDREKRPMQGRIASRYADVIILTDEDPRFENRMAILKEIVRGCEGKTEGGDLFLIPDRGAAIRHALSIAAPGDVVFLLGKGHEGSIVFPDGAHPYDERAEAETALREMGYGGP
jgi:UDP-N-acetylmuramoyl-L-alanyl-D-glutamate--2,6-diaminopimelate ligase